MLARRSIVAWADTGSRALTLATTQVPAEQIAALKRQLSLGLESCSYVVESSVREG